MATITRLWLIAAVFVACTAISTHANDRYADWRGAEQDAVAEDTPAATAEEPSMPAQFIPPTELTPEAGAAVEPAAVATIPTDEPTAAPAVRRLPFRFKAAPPGFDHSKVIRASATEEVPKPISKATESRSLPLRPREKESAGSRSPGGLPSAATLFGSLSIVVGLFCIVAWMTKRGMPKQPPMLPREALEVLGRQRFGNKQELQLLRLGNKLVLLHVVAGHAEPLVEVSDPEEVDRLTGICYQTHPHSSSRGFRQTFEQFAKEKPAARTASRRESDKLDLSMFDDLGRASTRTH